MRDECNSHAQPTTLEETEVGTVLSDSCARL